MTHALLAELEYGIAHLPFVLPTEEKEKIIRVLETLKADASASEEAIKQAMFEIGVVEYPYRKAYREVFAQKEAAEFLALVLSALEQALQGKYEVFLAGRSLKEGMNDAQFLEVFNGEERQVIEAAMNESKARLPEVMAPEVEQDAQLFAQALARHTAVRDELLTLIETLGAFAAQEGPWQEELRAVLVRAREGFLLTEPDPELEELRRLKEYWEQEINKHA
jgi:hypothetical protein